MSSAFERIGHGQTLDKMSQVPLILIVVGYLAISGALFWSYASPQKPSVQPVERTVLPAEGISPCPHSGELASCDVGESDG
jgi:hypothetical protein